jgi:hypothetical protein
VCAVADDLAKMDVLIETSERWCAVMRAECEPLAARARAEARLQSVHLEKALVKPDAAPMLAQTEAAVEEGQKRPNQATTHQEVAPASEPQVASPSSLAH